MRQDVLDCKQGAWWMSPDILHASGLISMIRNSKEACMGYQGVLDPQLPAVTHRSWSVEHSYYRAAAAIRTLAQGARPEEPAPRGWFEEEPEEFVPQPPGENPYFGHLPNVCWRLMVRFGHT